MMDVDRSKAQGQELPGSQQGRALLPIDCLVQVEEMRSSPVKCKRTMQSCVAVTMLCGATLMGIFQVVLSMALPEPPHPPPLPPAMPSPPAVPSSCCMDSCSHAHDGFCDDGGVGSDYSECSIGADCSDCEPFSPPIASPLTAPQVIPPTPPTEP
ncbi:hypothetical protein AB1Y20_000517 [Prymnesium parvum]|uniref:Uncharacterized protein n=1 Tax=Prymnesium parvum TaxID=97485 RepID=A0AB34K8P9_PRYPA